MYEKQMVFRCKLLTKGINYDNLQTIMKNPEKKCEYRLRLAYRELQKLRLQRLRQTGMDFGGRAEISRRDGEDTSLTNIVYEWYTK